MAIVQISKIQVRRGKAADLPGQPTNLTPLVFETALDTGEFGFATDEGRLFIGADPAEGQPNYQRTIFPYQNVEVITENSTALIGTLVGNAMRDPATPSFYEANLGLAASNWAPVTIVQNGQANYQFRLDYGTQIAARIEYSAFDADLNPVRAGTLHVMFASADSAPDVFDDAICQRRYDLVVPDAYDATDMFDNLSFNFAQAGSTGATYLGMEYMNKTNSTLTLLFRLVDPRP